MKRLYIKDLATGDYREYGSDQHDSLVSFDDGKTLEYYNLQNGDGSGEHGLYRFCDEDGSLLHVNDIGGEIANIGGFYNQEDVFGGSRIEKTTEEERKYMYVNGRKFIEDFVHKMKESECTTEEMNFYKMLEESIKK